MPLQILKLWSPVTSFSVFLKEKFIMCLANAFQTLTIQLLDKSINGPMNFSLSKAYQKFAKQIWPQ